MFNEKQKTKMFEFKKQGKQNQVKRAKNVLKNV